MTISFSALLFLFVSLSFSLFSSSDFYLSLQSLVLVLPHHCYQHYYHDHGPDVVSVVDARDDTDLDDIDDWSVLSF